MDTYFDAMPSNQRDEAIELGASPGDGPSARVCTSDNWTWLDDTQEGEAISAERWQIRWQERR